MRDKFFTLFNRKFNGTTEVTINRLLNPSSSQDLQWCSQKKRTCKQEVCRAAAPLKLEMFSCRGWQKFMSGNCSFVFSMHNNWWMKTIKSIIWLVFLVCLFLFIYDQFQLQYNKKKYFLQFWQGWSIPGSVGFETLGRKIIATKN